MDPHWSRELHQDYLDQSLSDEKKQAVEAHNITCPPCRADLEGLREIIALTQKIPSEPAPPAVTAAIFDRIRQPAEPPRRRRAVRLMPLWSSVAALLVLGFAFLAIEETRQPDPTPDTAPAGPKADLPAPAPAPEMDRAEEERKKSTELHMLFSLTEEAIADFDARGEANNDWDLASNGPIVAKRKASGRDHLVASAADPITLNIFIEPIQTEADNRPAVVQNLGGRVKADPAGDLYEKSLNKVQLEIVNQEGLLLRTQRADLREVAGAEEREVNDESKGSGKGSKDDTPRHPEKKPALQPLTLKESFSNRATAFKQVQVINEVFRSQTRSPRLDEVVTRQASAAFSRRGGSKESLEPIDILHSGSVPGDKREKSGPPPASKYQVECLQEIRLQYRPGAAKKKGSGFNFSKFVGKLDTPSRELWKTNKIGDVVLDVEAFGLRLFGPDIPFNVAQTPTGRTVLIARLTEEQYNTINHRLELLEKGPDLIVLADKVRYRLHEIAAPAAEPPITEPPTKN